MMVVLMMNLVAGVFGLLALRAFWPRDPLREESTSARAFYYSLLAIIVAFTGNALVKGAGLAIIAGGVSPALGSLLIAITELDDTIWRTAGAAACLGFLRAKLLALDDEDRKGWNLLTIPWHPNQEHLMVRICRGFTGWGRR